MLAWMLSPSSKLPHSHRGESRGKGGIVGRNCREGDRYRRQFRQIHSLSFNYPRCAAAARIQVWLYNQCGYFAADLLLIESTEKVGSILTCKLPTRNLPP